MKNNSGYLLIESMVAITVLTIGFLSVFSLVNQSIGLSRVINDQFTANYLAAEGIELVKNLIDANYLQSQAWNQGFNDGDYEIDYNGASLGNNSSKFLLLDSNGYYNYQNGSEMPFKRTIVIKNNSSDEIKVNSIVKWIGRGGINLEVNLEDHFFNNR
ncbi:prepilin-type N-terminal cleavage/methylation domain-containing protein [Candidatus Wolfebacteria bacterium]|nr:prepilin-type N-terminal cleavage/methylation domain-containing protein [Candidatus Wolfebacteria bacterium]